MTCTNSDALHTDSGQVTAIDPVLEMLVHFKNKEHLHEMIDMLFFNMDDNGNGVLEYEDLFHGFQNLKIPVVIDEEVWTSISGGRHTDITLEMFRECMTRQLRVFMETRVADELMMETIADGEQRNMFTALKLLMLNTSVFPTKDSWSQQVSAADKLVETLGQVSNSVVEMQRMMLLQEKRMTRLEKALNVEEETPHDRDHEAGITPSVVKRERKSRRERKKAAEAGVGEEQKGEEERENAHVALHQPEL